MSPKKITRPLDIYVRVSQVRGREGESFISPKDQEERCRQAISARGLEVGEVLTDLDQSGGKMDRPAFNEALERIREGISGGIVVAKIDRFGRTAARALLAVEEINSLGGVVIAAEGDLDTSTEIGEFVLGIMLQLAQLELRRIRTNWTSAKQHAVDRSLHISPRVPVGYRRQEAAKGEVGKNGKPKVKVLGPLEPDGKHADTIREAFRMAAQGDSYRAIANLFNERGLPIWGGDGVWQPNRIRRVLANRVYLGEAAGGNGHRKAGAHEALVDEATFLLAQRHVDRSAPVSTAAATMLAGICRCASCSFSLKAKTHRGERAALYRCMTAKSVHGSCPDLDLARASRGVRARAVSGAQRGAARTGRGR
jgi:DNA invertase Pin-like site-specific DNA recombinase